MQCGEGPNPSPEEKRCMFCVLEHHGKAEESELGSASWTLGPGKVSGTQWAFWELCV